MGLVTIIPNLFFLLIIVLFFLALYAVVKFAIKRTEITDELRKLRLELRDLNQKIDKLKEDSK